jgi:hypothetical protein
MNPVNVYRKTGNTMDKVSNLNGNQKDNGQY